ncbi:MAG: phenylacetate--CoA ligase family protein [Alphaproteobacteria bacterium]
MSKQALKSKLPILHAAVDWDELFTKFPVPDVFEETVYRWPSERVRERQNERFREVMALGWSNEFHRRRWSAAGLEPADIRGIDDIGKLPTFNSDDIKTDQQENPPFGLIHGDGLGMLKCHPLKLQTSGGTTGTPRPTLFGPVDWEMNAITEARGLYIQGARPGDVMQIPATCSLANLGWCCYKACHDYLGVLPLTTGSGIVTASRRQLEIAFSWGTNLWLSFPEYLTQLAKVCRDELGRDVRELKTKFIACFLGPDIDGSLRRQLEELWGCPVYDNYGTHEMALGAFECQHKAGLHFMEDCSFFEVLDVETGKPVANGETGNLVVTILHRRVPPMIRFNLRDLARIVSEAPCACGSSFRRMDHFLGRSDDMVKLRGVNVYPMACLPAVNSDKRTTGQWLCIVDRHERAGVIRDEMTVKIEVRRDAGGVDGLVERLAKRLQSDLGVKVDVELVEEGSLAEAANVGREGKARRLLDRRFRKP